jgi:hypothetical protein
MTALAAVIPAPNPTNKILSPVFTRELSTASNSAKGIDADDVLPVS